MATETIDWRDMASAPLDGRWVRLRVRAFGEEYVSNHGWRWADNAWHSPHYPLRAYGAEPIAWASADGTIERAEEAKCRVRRR